MTLSSLIFPKQIMLTAILTAVGSFVFFLSLSMPAVFPILIHLIIAVMGFVVMAFYGYHTVRILNQ